LILSFDRPDGTSVETSASGAKGMGLKSRADQISHVANDSLPLQPWCVSLGASRGEGHRSLVTPERVWSDYNEGLIIFIW